MKSLTSRVLTQKGQCLSRNYLFTTKLGKLTLRLYRVFIQGARAGYCLTPGWTKQSKVLSSQAGTHSSPTCCFWIIFMKSIFIFVGHFFFFLLAYNMWLPMKNKESFRLWKDTRDIRYLHSYVPIVWLPSALWRQRVSENGLDSYSKWPITLPLQVSKSTSGILNVSVSENAF